MNSTVNPILGLQTIAERESLLLAPYATFSRETRGRQHRESEHPYRGPFQRDRDRILHSAAYRRLSGKTQVFTNMGDYHRTRLTHTQEVASIARTIGRALRLNEDLIEALALFHDIGHPPYGHAGEDALHECLANHGGFSHNQHALTIARELETRYQEFPGLNLSHEVLAGQETRVDKTESHRKLSLEAQVVDAADSITYDAHDSDDALELGILGIEQLAEIPLIQLLLDRVHERYGRLNEELLRRALVHELIDYQVSDVFAFSGAYLANADFANAKEAQDDAFRIVPSPTVASQKAELEAFLYTEVYRHAKLLTVRTEAQRRLKQMFAGFVEHPEWLPDRIVERAERNGLEKSIGEFLANMTDRKCDSVYSQRFA